MAEQESKDEDKERVAFPWTTLVLLIFALIGYQVLSRHNVSYGYMVPVVNTVVMIVMLALGCRSLNN